jgi:hypothetical protein
MENGCIRINGSCVKINDEYKLLMTQIKKAAT